MHPRRMAMTLYARTGSAAEIAASPASYDPILKMVHWVSLIFVLAAYIAVWVSRGATSGEQSALLHST